LVINYPVQLIFELRTWKALLMKAFSWNRKRLEYCNWWEEFGLVSVARQIVVISLQNWHFSSVSEIGMWASS